VSISAPEDTIAEAESGTFRIGRDRAEGDLSVTLEVSGDASFNKDYTIRGANRFEKKRVKVTIPDGRTFAELTVKAVDDIPAEANETITLTLSPGVGYKVNKAASSATVTIPQNDFTVTTKDDAGEGSLRQAIMNANALEGPDTITFDSTIGPFATPQTIELSRELPYLVDEVAIDGYVEGRLWKPCGVTVSGGGNFRVFTVASGAKLSISSLTVANGKGSDGGGILNRGELVVRSMTFMDNDALYDGGGLLNLGGTVTVINSTFVNNKAGNMGGGLADHLGKATVTNCTFSGNAAEKGGALFSSGTMLLRNTILANSDAGGDCVALGTLDPASTNNLIQANQGCGEPISTADPRLGKLGGYNGPTYTIPLGGGSPAINLGDNGSAVDENGGPLKWDQRGNGDPRFVGGITDIGAYEHQRHPDLTVDTFEDTLLRACTRAGNEDCSLRGAIILANASSKPCVINFDPRVFSEPRTIWLTHPLPELTTEVTMDASNTAGVTVSGSGRFKVFNLATDTKFELLNVTVAEEAEVEVSPAEEPPRPRRGCLLPFF